MRGSFLACLLLPLTALGKEAIIQVGSCTISNDGVVNDVNLCGISIQSLISRLEALEAVQPPPSPPALPPSGPPPSPSSPPLVYSFVRLVHLAVTASHMPNTGRVAFYDVAGQLMTATITATNPSSCRSAFSSRLSAAAATSSTCDDVGFWWPGNPACTDASWDLRQSPSPVGAIEFQHVFSGHRGTLMALQGSAALGPWTTLATFDYNTSPGFSGGCYSGACKSGSGSGADGGHSKCGEYRYSVGSFVDCSLGWPGLSAANCQASIASISTS